VELRHLRYFVAIAEAQTFVGAAERLHIAQSALSRQIRDLEDELGVRLFERLPHGVRLTSGGDAFLAEARATLAGADRAVTAAREAGRDRTPRLRFSHGELSVFSTVIEDLLGAFRAAHPATDVSVTQCPEVESVAALRRREVDVAVVSLTWWPVEDFAVHRIVDISCTGVLVSAAHPAARRPSVRLRDLAPLTWLHTPEDKPTQYFDTLVKALHERGFDASNRRARPRLAPMSNTDVANGEAWTLANERYAARYLENPSSIVYRPMEDPPIPAWLGLVWLPDNAETAEQLVAVAQDRGLGIGGTTS
jgi:DNA-binding transcriptional LysR family regulator